MDAGLRGVLRDHSGAQKGAALNPANPPFPSGMTNGLGQRLSPGRGLPSHGREPPARPSDRARGRAPRQGVVHRAGQRGHLGKDRKAGQGEGQSEVRDVPPARFDAKKCAAPAPAPHPLARARGMTNDLGQTLPPAHGLPSPGHDPAPAPTNPGENPVRRRGASAGASHPGKSQAHDDQPQLADRGRD
jgi:hypothetical protein